MNSVEAGWQVNKMEVGPELVRAFSMRLQFLQIPSQPSPGSN